MFALKLVLSYISVAAAFPSTRDVQIDFELSIVHINDFHARFEPIKYGTETICSTDISECMGGFSRVYTLINKLKRERPNTLVLNAGDNFQGTLWYNIFKWEAVLHFMNLLPFDAYTLGNHEFDDGIKGLIPFLKGVNSKVVVANIDDAKEPDFQNLYNKSVVVTLSGIRVGIIGAIVQTTSRSLKSGRLVFLDESSSVNREAEKLAAEEQVDTIIVLSHCGYDVDIAIARNASAKIGVIVGGHSHTFLYTGDIPPGPDKPLGEYPTVIEHEDGRKVLIVQASAFTKYLGNITVFYDKDGNVVSWEGAPIFIDDSIPQDAKINEEIDTWKEFLESYKNKIVGETKVLLDFEKCWSGECNIGDLIADAQVWTYQQLVGNTSAESKYAPIGLINAGGIRSSIDVGNITYADLLTVHPFSNTWDYGYIQGRYIVEAISQTIGRHLMQISGLRAVYDFVNLKAYNISVRCPRCPSGYEDLNPDQSYLVVVPSFLAQGGDGLKNFAANLMNHTVGPSDIDSLMHFLEEFSPITQETDGRILRADSSYKDSKNSGGSAMSSAKYVPVLLGVMNLIDSRAIL